MSNDLGFSRKAHFWGDYEASLRRLAARPFAVIFGLLRLNSVLLSDEWTVRLRSPLEHQWSKSLRTRHHWLRSCACHRQNDEPPESSQWSSCVCLCGFAWPRLIVRCWNMNQSAGAAQHGRRYSIDEKVRTHVWLMRFPRSVSLCGTDLLLHAHVCIQ